MQLVLQLTRDCNLDCTYCYQRHRPGRGMTADVAERALRWLLGEGHGHVAVTFFGGEPLLERAAIEAAWPRLREAGAAAGALVTAKVSTNGALLDRGFAAFARASRLFVSLSTDGGPAAQDSGRPRRDGGPTSVAVDAALAALREARAPFATYQVITPANVRHLPASVDWLFARASRILVTSLDVSAAWSGEDLDRLGRAYRALARRYVRWTRRGIDFHLAPFDSKIAGWVHPEIFRQESCCAGVRQFAVDPEGFIYPCIEFLESPAYRIGHVDSGIDRAAFKALWADRGGEAPEECAGCGIRDRCASRCACLNLRTQGSLRGVDALLCAHEKLVTLASDRIGARLWRKRVRGFVERHYDPWHRPLQVLERIGMEAAP